MAQVRMINAGIGQMPKILRVAPYCRVSTSSADQLNSYATQIRVYKRMVEQRKEWQLVEVFADEGLSGTSAKKRPEFMRMIRMCEAKEIDLIICKALSRFARNVKEALEYVRKLKLLGIGVMFEKEGINTLSIADEMLLSTFSAIAQEESVATSTRLRNANTKRMMRGEFIDGNAPYGYRMVGRNLEIYDPEAEIVRWIFDQYLMGVSSHEIAKKLNERQVPSKMGATWSPGVIRYILRNEKYMGDTLYQKTYHTDILPFKQKRNRGEEDQYYAEDTHAGIVSKEMFDKVRSLIDSRKEKTKSVSEPVKYTFTAKMHCTCCGAFFIRKKTKGGLVTWVCSRHLEDRNACPSFYYREERIQNAFLSVINKLRFGDYDIIEQAEKQMEQASAVLKRSNPEARNLSQSLSELNGKLLMIEQLKAKGYLTFDVYQRQSTEIVKEISSLKEKRSKLLDTEIEDVLSEIRKMRQRLSELSEPLDAFDEILFEELIKNIEISNEDRITFKLLGDLTFTEQL